VHKGPRQLSSVAMRLWNRISSHATLRAPGIERVTEVYADVWQRLIGRDCTVTKPKQLTKKQRSLAEAEKAMFKVVQQPLEHRMTRITPTFLKNSSQPCYISSVSTIIPSGEAKKPDLVLVHGCK
jgi:hypothetical protein